MAADSRRRTPILDRPLLFLIGLAIVTGSLAVWIRGISALSEAAVVVLSDLLLIVPMIIMGVWVGTLFTLLVPRDVIARHLGHQAGLRGILLASCIGTVMPAGPFASFPLVLALGRSGASIGALIAFLTAWAAVGLNRLVIWELPFMGVEFSMLRFIASLPMPVLAGLFAEWLSVAFVSMRVRWEDI